MRNNLLSKKYLKSEYRESTINDNSVAHLSSIVIDNEFLTAEDNSMVVEEKEVEPCLEEWAAAELVRTCKTSLSSRGYFNHMAAVGNGKRQIVFEFSFENLKEKTTVFKHISERAKEIGADFMIVCVDSAFFPKFESFRSTAAPQKT